MLALSLLTTTAGASMHASESIYLKQDKLWTELLNLDQGKVHSSRNNEKANALQFPQDETCWQIQRVVMTTRAKDVSLDFLQPLIKQAEGKCLGHNGITFLTRKIHNEFIRKGFINSYVDTPSQDLRSGTLKYKVNPGRVTDRPLLTESYHHLTLNTSLPKPWL
ncbi:Hemolysin activation/secretion protein [Enterobacter sp. CC120223-11]|nr:Hemolysin activation/secretion protein [Enterobacter sp. CC120223-11]